MISAQVVSAEDSRTRHLEGKTARMIRLHNGLCCVHATWQHTSQAVAVQRSTTSQGPRFLILMLHMLCRSQNASQMPSWPAAAGYRHVPYAPGPAESPRNVLAPRFAAPAAPLHDMLAPRFAATEAPLRNTLAPRFAAMEVSPHGAIPGKEQAGEPALLAAGACLHSPHPGRTLPLARCRIGCTQHRC